ncbi:T-complex protein 11-like protein 2 [Neosynchiropus ocellatus]
MPNHGDSSTDDPHDDLPPLEQVDSPTGSLPPAASLMELQNCVSNLSLAHEIVMNRDFSFTPSSPPKESLEGRVTEIVHRAFWDSLSEQLNSQPPNYAHAIVLLQEVKSLLESLLLPRHVRLRSQLDEVLDMDLIRLQVQHGALDLDRLAAYIINTMAALCAPVRDPEISALKELKEPVELLRGIFRVLGLMKADMVSFTVQSLRPHLLQQAVAYERTKFQQILDKQPAALDWTWSWLEAAASDEASAHSSSSPPPSATAILNRAYMRLLTWDPLDQKYPETVAMDRARLEALSGRLRLLTLEASVLLLTRGTGAAFPQGFVARLRQTVAALLEGRHSREDELKEALLSLGEMAVQQVQQAVIDQGGPPPSTESQEVLSGQISTLWKTDHPVRSLVGERLQGFLWALLEGSSTQKAPELPASLGLVSQDLLELGTTLRRTVHFNRTVFGPFYAPMLRKLMFPTEAVADDSR